MRMLRYISDRGALADRERATVLSQLCVCVCACISPMPALYDAFFFQIFEKLGTP